MLWVVLSLATAVFSATEAAWLKRFFGDIKPMEMAAVPLFWASPMFVAALAVMARPELGPDFWLWLLAMVPINCLGFALHMGAVNVSPLSVTIPYLAFTPAFTILIGWLFLGETLSWAGIGGIGGVVAGSYVLGLDGSPGSWRHPLANLLREPGSIMALGASFIYAICVTGGKMVFLQSSPLWGSSVYFLLMSVLFIGFFSLTGHIRPRMLPRRPLAGLGVGVIFFCHIFAHASAVTIAKVAYMVAIKRLNGLFAVLYGWALFREGQMRYRLTGAACMSAGAMVIVLWG